MASDGPERDELAEKVIGIIASRKHLPPERVTLDSTFADLSVDSLDAIDLVFEFEDTFDVNIPDQVAHELKSVRQAVDALRQATAQGTAGAS